MCYGVWETQTEVTNLLGEWVLMTFMSYVPDSNI